jgi:hypothetical protein
MSEESKLTVKFQDGSKEFDLSKPDDLEKLKEQASKGYAYEQGQTQLKEAKEEAEKLREKYNAWNTRLTSAISDEEARKQLITDLESMGLKLTDAQKKDDEYLQDTADDHLKKLESKVDELSKHNNQLESTLYNMVIEQEHKRLEQLYPGDNGYPKYDRKKVEEFATNEGINQLERAYKELNEKEIEAARVKAALDKEKKHKQKLGKVASNEPDNIGDELKPKPKKFKNYSQASRDWLEELRQGGGEPLFK